MKELFRSSDTGRIGLYQSLLDEADIAHFVRNDATQQLMVGGVLSALFPVPDFWPTLCVLSDDDYPEALELLRAFCQDEGLVTKEWPCHSCGETAPGTFTECWYCQTQRPTEPPAEGGS